jgi:hypothetical protein
MHKNIALNAIRVFGSTYAGTRALARARYMSPKKYTRDAKKYTRDAKKNRKKSKTRIFF